MLGKTFLQNPIESFYVELNLRTNKWVINCSYNPHKCLIRNHLDAISKTLDLHSSTYDKIMLLGDFNTEIDEQHMQSFCDNYSLKSLIRQLTCYKNFEKTTCIDLILTNILSVFKVHVSSKQGCLIFIWWPWLLWEKNSKKLNLEL